MTTILRVQVHSSLIAASAPAEEPHLLTMLGCDCGFMLSAPGQMWIAVRRLLGGLQVGSFSRRGNCLFLLDHLVHLHQHSPSRSAEPHSATAAETCQQRELHEYPHEVEGKHSGSYHTGCAKIGSLGYHICTTGQHCTVTSIGTAPSLSHYTCPHCPYAASTDKSALIRGKEQSGSLSSEQVCSILLCRLQHCLAGTIHEIVSNLGTPRPVCRPFFLTNNVWQAHLRSRCHMLGSVDVGASISSWRLGLLDQHLRSW